MGGLFVRRLLTGLPTLLLVVALSFMLMRIAPGGPFDGERALDPATRAALASRYGLDKALGEQFLSFIGGLLRGDFGPSMVYRDFSVTSRVAHGRSEERRVGEKCLSQGESRWVP